MMSDPCYYFDETATVATDEQPANGIKREWLPLVLEGAVLALVLAAGIFGMLRGEHQA
jgi:hypothetical protein